MKAGIVLHGKKRQTSALCEKLESLIARDIDTQLRITTKARETIEISRTWSAEKDLIIVSGGDGSLHEAVNGLMQAKAANPQLTLPALALLPCGTGNDFARMHGWQTGNVEQLVDRIRRWQTAAVDIGKLVRAPQPELYFVNAIDAGLGAHVVEYAERMKGFWPNSLVFPLAILRGLLTYRRQAIQWQSAGHEFDGESLTTVVSLGRSFADGIVIAPDAGVNDGLFRIARIGKVSLLEYFRFLPALKRGEKISHPEVFYFTAASAELSGHAAVEADGEPAGPLPVRVELIPGAIRMLM
ncbi:MAG: diacylglycerol/lipid kinase family protein [Flavobacteriales bacterium]|jgi:diacylglycerol kinase (ATP)